MNEQMSICYCIEEGNLICICESVVCSAPSSPTTHLTICTEENPQLNELQFILNHLGFECTILAITPNCTSDRIWNGTFNVRTDHSTLLIHLHLVKGSGSFVDYIVYDHEQPNHDSIPILLMESTKTNDAESRNTAINQRFTKFPVVRYHFPNTPLIMYYNTIQQTRTQTSLFGRRLLTTYGVKIFDKTGRDMTSDAPPFTSVEEIIAEKNSFKENKRNISVRITRDETDPHTYRITAKLSKGANTTISHDPNKGLITGIASAIYSLDKEARFVITNHCVELEKIKRPNEKFWYANKQYDLRLEGSAVSSRDAILPKTYWKYDRCSEKASTILYQMCREQNGWQTIYHNHSSSARSYFRDASGEEHQVPKKITIPDVVMVHTESRTIQICEGKISGYVKLGITQLNNLKPFIDYILTHYEGYTIQCGLSLYLPNSFAMDEFETMKKNSAYEVFFALDSFGKMYE